MNKYPPDPPSRRTIWIMVAFIATISVASVVHHLVAIHS
jgi:hypothetical protein